MSTTEPAIALGPQLPPLLLAPRWLSPQRLMVAAVLLGAGALSLARVDNTPGMLMTAGLVLAAWLPALLPLRRWWVRWLWVLWSIALGLGQVAWLAVYDFRQQITVRGADGSDVSCWVQLANKHSEVFSRLVVLRFLLLIGVAALLAGFGALRRAYRRETMAPCHDSTEQFAIIAGAWLALAGGLCLLDVVSMRNRERVCDSYSYFSHDRGSRRPAICEPLNGRSVDEVGELCYSMPTPATRPFAITLGSVVLLLGATGAVSAAVRIRRRRRWLDGWLKSVETNGVAGWSLVLHASASIVANEAPWLARTQEDAAEGAYRQLIFTPIEVHDPDANYRREPSGPVVIARIEETAAVRSLAVVRRGERSARILALVVVVVCAVMFTPLVQLFSAFKRRL